MIVSDEVEEEEEVEVSLIMRKTIADAEAHKVVEGIAFRGAQLLAPAILEQAEKHYAASDALLEKVVVGRELMESVEVQATEVIAWLKSTKRTSKAELLMYQKKVYPKLLPTLLLKLLVKIVKLLQML